MATLVRTDLEFILQQILIAEANAAGTPLTDLITNPFLSLGLRTVDGSYNNLVPGQQYFGAADQQFPRLLEASFGSGDIFGTYASTGTVVDSQPRTISNLIVDQTANNPAAAGAGGTLVASPGLDGIFGTADDTEVYLISNTTPDEGLSAPFNSWFTFFGQFFDHGLDLVNKGNEVVVIPLLPDDPLFVPGGPNFMMINRVTQVIGAGADGILVDDLGTAINEELDNTREAVNQTTPFVDQNQTYTSHASHQFFLREYVAGPSGPVATGKLLEGSAGGLATWADIKTQALTVLGIALDDSDVLDVPLVLTDAYGNFIPDPATGMPQLITGPGTVIVGNIATPADATLAVNTGHAFLNDIAHAATPGAGKVADLDTDVGPVPNPAFDAGQPEGPLNQRFLAQPAGTYDDELLEAHFITGDGRGNENIALTAVHHVFHSEHNRQVDEIQTTLVADAIASGNLAFLNDWLTVDVAAVTLADIPTLAWDGERLFQAARFATEMQYQHLVFEEFARKVAPNVDVFLAPIGYDITIDPAILAEFAHVVYRFGHSMLTETVDRYDPAFNVIGNPNGLDPADQHMGLIAAFLNPLAFTQTIGGVATLTADEGAGAVVRGMTRQAGNEIDEFVTEALRNNLVGLPLDLASINIARGRDTGVPTLNEARRAFFDMTQDTQLAAYKSWVDFAGHLKHEASVVNFIAAYGTHAAITGATTLADKRAAAATLVFGDGDDLDGVVIGGNIYTDRLDFLNATGAFTGGSLGGLEDIDLWIGGLAEKQMPFGGLLGSTFNFVFETQLESLQNGDRFYYLARTAGLEFAAALENNSFAKLIMANTNATHLPKDVFSTPAWILEVDQAAQFTGLGLDGRADPLGGTDLIPLVIRDNPETPAVETNYLRYTGADHVVLGGTAGNDTLISSIGDDTIYGDGGNDRIEGGDGVDNIMGGDGDDIITDLGGDDVIKGEAGNDVIQGGNGFNILFGDTGHDFIITGEDISQTFAGEGNDFIFGTLRNVESIGGSGHDWLEIGHQEGSVGDTFDPTGRDLVAGHDVFITGPEFDDVVAEGGDDIIFGSDGQEKMDGASGFDWADYKFETRGVSVDLVLQIANATPATPSTSGLLDLFAFVEGLSGSSHADVLRGNNVLAADLAFSGAQGSVLDADGIAMIAGLQTLLGAGVTSFNSGNIILGGDGSDIIEGRRGDDLIDGDRWLNARISVRANIDGTGAEIRSVDSMRDLIPDMLSGAINPGQLQIVREILTATGPDVDTARYSGARANYTISTAADGTTTVTDNFGTLLGTDGTDTLRNIERLQFADVAMQYNAVTGQFVIAQNSATNAGPSGLLEIRDAALNAADNTPAVNQVLSVFSGNVTDANNAGGSISGRPITYYWQVESAGVNGAIGQYWEDIVAPAGLAGAPTAATGPTFQVPALINGLAATGLSIRVRAEYLDDQGVLENVFSAPTAAVAGVVAGPPPPPPVPVESPTESAGVHLIRSDLSFILDQIIIAERHAAGESLLSMIGNERLPGGLRTVDGSFNNLVPGQTHFGAADNNFPLQLDQIFRNENDETPFFGVGNTNYATSGPGANVVDTDPRIISNLIVDQTVNNPVAYQTAYSAGVDGIFSYLAHAGQDGLFGTADDGLGADGLLGGAGADADTDDVLNDGASVINGSRFDGSPFQTFQFTNATPDEGLTAPFNAWMTFFGQFFDHGLDLVDKGGNGTIFIPLLPDDPLFVTGSPTNFMVVTRATNSAVTAGADQVFGTSDDVHFHNNETTPFIDQNQTYTSHASHQVFLREYVFNLAGDPVATGRLLDGTTADGSGIDGGIGNWAEVKAQAASMLGIQLTDANIFDAPLLATDAYGKFIPGLNGFAQFVTTTGLIEANPADNGGLGTLVPANALFTGHAFLNDIAHLAAPVIVAGVLQADADNVVGYSGGFGPQGNNLQYDDELLDAHFITGDGRGNENIGLTAVHSIFHSEHNRLVEHIKDVVEASNDPAFVAQWHLADGSWNGERLFQAARFATEMQYQHLVFEEFARTVQPQIDLFFAAGQVYDTTLNPAIVAEFAHVVYRFGHSMLTESVDRFDPNFNLVNGDTEQIGLIQAFLNPLEYIASGADATAANGAIVRGLTRSAGNEIDEFVTEALRNNLVGLPLDLPAINIARGRDTGVPTLNEARAEFFAQTGDTQLAPYTSWVDFAGHLRHEASVINFIAAYGTDATITSATTTAAKRAAAVAIVTGVDYAGLGGEAQRLAFLNGPAATTGVSAIDLWIGGLAEAQMPFGGLLGSTFNYVFETQMENLQDGDRFYYLDRTAGLNFLTELEGNSFAKLIMANTDATHLPGNVFQTPAWILEVDAARQFNDLDGDGDLEGGDPVGDGGLTPLVIRDAGTNYLRYTGEDHVVMGGTAGNDIIVGSIGDDSIYGDAGNDRLEGGDGVDTILGGAGDDIITDLGGDDLIQGGDGNDAIQGGNGINLIIGGFGQDFINSGEDSSEMFGGPGDDFLYGSRVNEQDMGNEGDDWLEHGNADGSPGDNFDPFGRDQVIGNDVYIGDTIIDIMNAEGGDDIMVGNGGQQDHYLGASGFDWAVYKDSPNGVVVFSDLLFENEATALGVNPSTLDRYFGVEGISGSQHSDYLVGSDKLTAAFATSGFTGSILTNFELIDGLRALVDPLVVSAVGQPDTFTGEILLGGGGSDYLKGGWGDEVIDGDAWLNVQIGVYGADDVNHTGPILERFNSMIDFQDRVFSGEINPGQLGIVREIRTTLLDGSPIGRDFDTAAFSGNLADYTIVIDDRGTVDTADDVYTVTDIGTGLDGVDVVRNIERLQFSDQSLVVGGLNAEAAGALVISDATPTEDQLLTVSIAGVTDANNVTLLNPTGAITGAVTYYWQSEGAGGVFSDIVRDDGITLAAVTGTSFQPTDAEVGFALRVRAIYQDANGVIEEVFSAPTDLVAAINDAPVGTVLISDTTPTETQALVAINAFTDADAPIDLEGGGVPPPIVYNYQWQQAVTPGVGGGALPAGFENILGATLAQFTPGQAQVNRELRVVVTYVDGQGFNETVISAATIVTGDFIAANGAAQILTGTEGQDIVFGGDGADNISTLGEIDFIDAGTGADLVDAGAGNDTIIGGTGDDGLNGGAGDDSFLYTIGDGADNLNGGADNDRLTITGTAAANVLDVVFNGTALTSIEGGAVTSVEVVTADLLGGTDTLNYAGSAAPVTVNLSTGTASGFTAVAATPATAVSPAIAGLAAIAGIENVTGGNGADVLTGDDNVNVLSGGAGTDTLSGLGGADTLNGDAGNDTLNGGAGNDTLNGGTQDDLFVAAAGDGNDAISGGTQSDTYDLSATTAGAIVIVTSASSADIGTDTLDSIENIIGSQGNDSITLNGAANRIDGQGGDDTLVGGTANDTLIGGAGNDTFTYAFGDGADSVDGGADTDTVNITGTAGANTLDVIFDGTALTAFENGTLTGVESVTANLGAGTDILSFVGTTAAVTVDLTAGTGSGGLNTLVSIENVVGGSGADNLTGVAGVLNTLTGGAGAANDTFTVHDTNDVVSEAGGVGGGIDLVQSLAANYTITDADVENLTLLGTGNINGTGNASANTITGNTGDNILSGLAANDIINGGDGADVIIGGTGIDNMTGGIGIDTFDFNAFNESGIGAGNNDVIVDFAGDLFDLSTLDANATIGGNQAFTFIGTAAFSDPTAGATLAAGQVRYVQSGGDTFIQVNSNNNLGTIEFEIRLTGTHTLTATDFIL